jgi:hypothetical protein
MLGKEPSNSSFTGAMASFLKSECGLSAAAIERVFVGNATRFLAIRKGDSSRERLLQFYATNSIEGDPLPVF